MVSNGLAALAPPTGRRLQKMITQAFVLGAGLGVRMRPLTEDLPKPFIPIFQKPLITFALDHLIAAGVKSFVINTHYRAEVFENFFAEGNYRGCPVQLVHEPEILGTGGGIKNIQPLLGREPFLSYSGDLLTDVNLELLIEEHFRAGNDVTMALRSGGLRADVASEQGRVVDIANRYGYPGKYDYAGLAVWTPGIFPRIPPGRSLSFIPVVTDWIGQGGKIGAVILDEGKWFNIGSRAEYLAAHRVIQEQPWRPAYVAAPEWPVRIARDAEIDSSARLLGFNSIGPGCRVGADAILQNTILWSGAQIASSSHLRNCIVRSHRKTEGVLSDTDI
jgi:mannose-1-phosphate guanylyltransferase